MEIRIETNSYNSKHYGSPWIAKVDYETDPQGAYTWGDWIGDHRGEEGVLSVNAEPGDLIATGQHDNRNPQSPPPFFSVVLLGGSLLAIGDEGEAYKYFFQTRRYFRIGGIDAIITSQCGHETHTANEDDAYAETDRLDALDAASYAQTTPPSKEDEDELAQMSLEQF